MARYRSFGHLRKRLLNLKPAAYASLRGLTAPFPPARHWLGFYPEIEPLPGRLESVAEDCEYHIKLAHARFAAQLEALAVHNRDACRRNIQHRDPFVSKRFVGIVRDVIVPGHRLTPVDPQSLTQMVFGQRGRSDWNYARPGPTILTSRRIAEPAFVLADVKNYWHLLLENLIPLIHATRLRAWGDGPLVVVTRRKRPPLVDAVLAGLREAEGVEFRVVEPSIYEHLRLDRMLVAVNQCWNVERSYALAEEIPAARRVFAAAYRERPSLERPRLAAGPRLYVSRGPSKLRRMTNEGEVIEGLERRGFQVLQATWSNHPDQLEAFSRAALVVGVHGAGLTNIVFARPGTNVLEIFPADHRKTSYLHLSAEHDLGYQPFFGSPKGVNEAFSVDTKAFFAALDPLL